MIISWFGPMDAQNWMISSNTWIHPIQHSNLPLRLRKQQFQIDHHRLLYSVNSYLHFSSCHPHHQKTGDSYSQLLRVKCICAQDTDFENNSQNIVENYHHRGYPATTLLSSLLMKKRNTQQRLLYSASPHTIPKILRSRTFSNRIDLLSSLMPNYNVSMIRHLTLGTGDLTI